ncbi:hypothetical protein DRE_00215 [Drechslerella stenobrocha 248]|uniref:Uncharacterized protein n=1 Tax=Drechslerella stenobrocha 248 TaxID=1043628 RepID=W7IHY7_9PEZI|nr:hypothetical protein DRE_00215 [Drechslerella stenobrocha 248]
MYPGKGPSLDGRKHGVVKRNCTRRWWFWLIFFVIANVAIVVGIVCGVIPIVAQNSVTNAIVRADGIAITNPSDDRITLAMNATVFAHAPVKARFANQTFEMYLPDDKNQTTFMTLDVGELEANPTMAINVTGADTNILNKEIYQTFSKQVLSKGNFSLVIRSKPILKVGSLQYRVNFEKTVQLKGFNGLRGITITNPTILNGSAVMEDGTNLLTDGVIPNPSSFTMQIGDLTADISIDTLKLGFSVIKNLTLYPGDNAVKIYNHINPELMGLPMFSAILDQPNVNITLAINSTILNGQHISWLETPLREASPFYAIMNPGSAPAVGSAMAGGLS